MLHAQVLATGQALPERVVTTAELAARIGIDADRAEKATGVRERRWVSPEDDPVTFGARALTDALTTAGLTIDDVDVLIHASGSMPQPIPDGSAHIAQLVGFEGRPAFSVHSTCVSAVVAMHQASLLIETGSARVVAIVTCEVASRGLDRGHPENALLFGDGAAAIILGPSEREGQGIEAYRSEIHPKGADATRIRAGGYRRPGLHEATDRAEFAFEMDGLRVLGLANRVLPGFLERLRPGLSTGLDGIDRVIPHQTSAAGTQLLQRYHWDADKVEVTLGHLGNVIAASIPLTLHQALIAGRIAPGDRVVLVGTGAGLTTTGLVMKW